jgi:hypothetical protein
MPTMLVEIAARRRPPESGDSLPVALDATSSVALTARESGKARETSSVYSSFKYVGLVARDPDP